MFVLQAHVNKQGQKKNRTADVLKNAQTEIKFVICAEKLDHEAFDGT